jgi:hypothetical protein
VRTQFVENCEPPPPFDYISLVKYSGHYLKRGEALDRLLELQRRLPSVFGSPYRTEVHADGLEVFMMQDYAADSATMALLDTLCSALPFQVRIRYSNGKQNFF